MKKRTIKPDFFIDTKTGRLDPVTQILFVGLWCLADREGYIENDTDFIKTQIFPYKNINIKKNIDELIKNNLVIACNYMGKNLINIVNFKKHQPIHPHEAQSKYPPIQNDDVIACNYMQVHPNYNNIDNNINNNIDNNIDYRIREEKNNFESQFEEFWKKYQLHKSKDAAKKKFLVLMKNSKNQNELFKLIIDGVERYNREIKTKNIDPKYVKHPSTWLNQGCWNDEYYCKMTQEERNNQVIQEALELTNKENDDAS